MWSDVLLCSNLTELSIICVRIWVHCPYKCLLCCLTSSISKKLLLPIVKHLNPYQSWHNISMSNKQAYFAYKTLNAIMVMPSLSRIVIHTQGLVDCYSYYRIQHQCYRISQIYTTNTTRPIYSVKLRCFITSPTFLTFEYLLYIKMS